MLTTKDIKVGRKVVMILTKKNFGTIIQVTNHSFTVRWSKYGNTKVYSVNDLSQFELYNEQKETQPNVVVSGSLDWLTDKQKEVMDKFICEHFIPGSTEYIFAIDTTEEAYITYAKYESGIFSLIDSLEL